MKDLIIGCSTGYNWNTLKYWVNSINKTGFEGDKVLILMNCDLETATKVNNAGFKVIGFNQDANGNLIYQHGKIPVHVERFLHIYEHLCQNEYRYVITTDVKDVIFQKNPFTELHKYILGQRQNLAFASESIRYKDEPWGNQNLLETYGNYTAAINRPIPICDQSTFNFMISQEPYKSTARYCKSEDAWACQLGVTADPDKIESFKPFLLEPIPRMENNKVVTSTGKEFTIVHQYDRVPEWRKIIEDTYA